MFTGIVEEIGSIEKILSGKRSFSMTIKAEKVLRDVKIGDSIAVNGVCLTVTKYSGQTFDVDVMPETINKSSLKNLKNGSLVNLERAVKTSDRLGGHIVSGHIDDYLKIENIEDDDNATLLTIEGNEEVLRYIVYKGSVAIDGVSLTVMYVDENRFKVSIIPQTKNETILLKKKIGDTVNIECDIVGKYIENFIKWDKRSQKSSNITESLLRENGFI